MNESFPTISGNYSIIQKALLKSKLKFRYAGDHLRKIYALSYPLIEFEVSLVNFNNHSRDYDLISLRWWYFGPPQWKYISIMEIFDYPISEDFKHFLIFNMDLFSQPLINYHDLISALEDFEDVIICSPISS